MFVGPRGAPGPRQLDVVKALSSRARGPGCQGVGQGKTGLSLSVPRPSESRGSRYRKAIAFIGRRYHFIPASFQKPCLFTLPVRRRPPRFSARQSKWTIAWEHSKQSTVPCTHTGSTARLSLGTVERVCGEIPRCCATSSGGRCVIQSLSEKSWYLGALNISIKTRSVSPVFSI